MQTNAIIFSAIEKAVIQKIEMPTPGPSEVQIRTAFSTISAGTEGWIYRNLFWSPTPYPCVPGYQRTGKIITVGSEVKGLRVGDHVMAIAGSWEGTVQSFWGSHLSVANSPAAHVFRLPKGMDEVAASSAVVAQVGYNAAYRATMKKDDWALVYGDGLIGQCAAQAARARGFKVILVGHRAERLKLAAKYSAHVVINNKREKVVETVQKKTKGKSIAVVLDSVQGEVTQKEYLPLLEPARGQIVYCGFSTEKTWADMALLQQKEITAHFIAGWTRPRMEATLKLMAAGKMRLRPLITHLVPCQRGPEMYEMIRRKSEPFLGITLDWT